MQSEWLALRSDSGYINSYAGLLRVDRLPKEEVIAKFHQPFDDYTFLNLLYLKNKRMIDRGLNPGERPLALVYLNEKPAFTGANCLRKYYFVKNENALRRRIAISGLIDNVYCHEVYGTVGIEVESYEYLSEIEKQLPEWVRNKKKWYKRFIDAMTIAVYVKGSPLWYILFVDFKGNVTKIQNTDQFALLT